MLNYKNLVTKLLQLGCLAYAVVALTYTTNYLLVSPVSSFLSRFLAAPRTASVAERKLTSNVKARVDLVTQAWQASHVRHDSDKPAPPWSFSSAESSLYLNDLNSNIDVLTQKQRESQALPTSIQEGIYLSKAFAQSMHPTKIIPFFYKAITPVDENDVTITTLVTSNRYKVLRQLVDRYQGEFPLFISYPFNLWSTDLMHVCT